MGIVVDVLGSTSAYSSQGINQTVSGNLTVTGTTTLQEAQASKYTLNVQGDTLSLGYANGHLHDPGWAEVYIERHDFDHGVQGPRAARISGLGSRTRQQPRRSSR